MRFAEPEILVEPFEPPAFEATRVRERGRPRPLSASERWQYQTFPSWAALTSSTPESAFLGAGVGLALLDGFVRQDAPFAGAWRQRLALQAAAASAKILRLREEEAALRDTVHLAISDAPGPAGRVHRLWRELAAKDATISAQAIGAALGLLDGLEAADADDLATVLQEMAAAAGDPVSVAARAASGIYARASTAEGDLLACWAADLVLARRLRWRMPLPLLLNALLKPALRHGPTGRRPRPNDPDWPQAVAQAYALASADAHSLAAQLSRRAETLLAVAPRLRARKSDQIVAMLLADDCLAPTPAGRRAGLSDRAARRLFERLVDLKAVREISGRPSFRLYGL